MAFSQAKFDERVDELWSRVQATEKPRAAPKFVDESFQEQAAFMRDPAKLKVLLCTRRSGKSYAVGRLLFEAAYEQPGASCLYVALTRDSAKKIMWRDVFTPLNRDLGLNAKPNLSELTWALPNAGIVYVLGADSDEEEKQKLLGQKYRLVVIDEAASFRTDLVKLVYGILKPAVADYRGTVCMIGTPDDLKTGLFYELTKNQDPGTPGRWNAIQDPEHPGQWTHLQYSPTNPGWSGHRWSWRENHYIRKQMEAEIAELKAANPRIEDTPLFAQHYLGRWVVDTDNLVYRYLHGRNDFDGTLPDFKGKPGRWHNVLGVDLGYSPDPSAFCLCAYHDHDRTLYIRECWSQLEMDITDVANTIKQLQKDYDVDSLVIDGANKQAVMEMQNRHGLPLLPADKRGKSDFIALMNDDFIQERIKLSPKCATLGKEYGGLIWDERALARGKRQEHPNCANHEADAALYSWRFCYQYLSKTLENKPAPGTPAWYKAQEDEMEKHVLEELRREQEASETPPSFNPAYWNG